jgi:RNA polymerase sigma-70 factor, ECF subfamily
MNADVLREMYTAGRERWPELDLDFEPFERHCAKVGGIGLSREEQPHGADLYLCCACYSGVREAAAALQREGDAVARAAISRIDRDPDFVQEVVQDLWDKLLLGRAAKVGAYAARGPLLGWVRVAATRVALDRMRARKTTMLQQSELNAELPAEGLSPEIRLIKARYGADFRVAFKLAVASLSGRERNVLHMYLKGGCNIDQIGKAYDVHRATAARWLEQARSVIYDTVRRELRTLSGEVTDSEFRSLARALRSDLDSNWFS